MATKNLAAVITIGGAVAGSLGAATGTATRQIDGIGAAVNRLRDRQKELNTLIAQQEKLGASGSALRVQYANAELSVIGRQIEALKQKRAVIDQTNKSMDAARRQMGNAAMGVGAGIAGLVTIGGTVAAAAKFETAMLGVAKQVEGARDASGQLTTVYFQMGQQIKQLGREIPIATNEIANMVTAGARMGVAREELIDFVRTSATLASAFDLPAGELAEQMGKIAGLFKIPIPQIGALADAINYLDDNAISKGADIIDFLTRTGGVAGTVKVTGNEMAALGSTLLTLGERAETASTATNALFQKLAAADKGSKKFKSAMAEIGLSTAEIQKGMQIDAQGTVLKLLEAINKLPAEKRTGVMVELVGLEHSDTLAKLATSTAEYRRQIELVNSAAAKGSAMREYQSSLASTEKQLQLLKNRSTEVAVNLGSVLLPVVNNAMTLIGGVASGVADWARENPGLARTIGTLAVSVGGAFVAMKSLSLGVGAAVFAFNALKLAVMTNPVGLVIGALATGALMVYQNWEPIKTFFGELWTGIVGGARAAFDWVVSKLEWVGAKVGQYMGIWRGLATGSIGAAVESARALFGVSGTDQGTGPATAAPTQSAAPAVRLRGGMVDNSTSTTNNTITITQQPGQDSRALADEVARRIEERERIKRASRMIDSAQGY